jgi:hypothetical protein
MDHMKVKECEHPSVLLAVYSDMTYKSGTFSFFFGNVVTEKFLKNNTCFILNFVNIFHQVAKCHP